VRSLVAARLGLAAAPRAAVATTVARPVGLVARRETGGDGESAKLVRDDPGGSAVLLAPLGRLTAAQVTWVADRVAGREARVTPWRSVVLPDLADAAAVLREAAGLGFGTDEASPWLRVTACAGRPGCASALADVQADAAGFAARWPGRIVHVSGCARHCGRPAATEIDVTATSEGYQVAGV
jgi:precorrin-3B synthase